MDMRERFFSFLHLHSFTANPFKNNPFKRGKMITINGYTFPYAHAP